MAVSVMLPRRWRLGLTASFAATSLLAGAFAAAPAQASVVTHHAAAPRVKLGPAARDVGTFHPRRARRLPNAAAHPYRAVHTSWPGATSGTAQLPAVAPAAGHTKVVASGRAPATGAVIRMAGSPVQAQAVSGGASGRLRVRVLAHAAALAAGVRGVEFTAAAAAGSGGQVRLGLSYAEFSQASGGNYGLSLGLVELPGCALTTPARRACETQKRLDFVNDAATQTVSAPVTLPAPGQGGSSGIVLAAAPIQYDGGGPAGSYSATTLKPSGAWSEGGSSGSFDYSYPMTVPPAAGGLVPDAGLSYDSAAVDGQTAATQEQASWAGDGWSTPQSYIEQSFTPCADDPEGSAAPQSTQDECYDGPTLTLSQGGSSNLLICPSSSFSYTKNSTCTESDDDGDVVTHVVGSGNGSGTKFTDYWTVTDENGTTYYYGLNQLPGWSSKDQATDSVDTEPVFSAHSADPCYSSSGFGSSACTMAYRWNLDYVTDLHGNAMAYYYDQSTNAYAEYGHTSSAMSYVRDSYLDHIDYGFTAGNAYTGHAPDEVEFGTSVRCVLSTCPALSSSTEADYPDVPYAQDYCAAGASNCSVNGPTFWSTVRLTSITTQQWNGSKYVAADSWALKQSFPSNGDNTAPALWLASIAHTGSDTTAGGSAVTLPAVSFTAQSLPNRVNAGNYPALDRNRIATITTETGSVITVSYELTNPCNPSSYPSQSANHSSCFPIYWGPFTTSAGPDWFDKYAVQSVAQSDPTGGSGGLFTSYTYSGAAWHYDDSPTVEAKDHTYSQWRGYQDVQTFTGTGSDAPTETETTYYQGMSDDNGSGTVTLDDSQKAGHDDTNQLAGDELETTDYDYSGGPVEDSTIYSYWVSPAVATGQTVGQDTLTANAVGEVEQWARQAITDTGTTTWRVTETDTSYDATPSDADFGLPLEVFNHGDISQPSQQTCTSTTYTAPNKSKNLVGLVAETEDDAVACGGSNPNGASAPSSSEINALTAPSGVSRPSQVVSDTRTFYDDPPVLSGGVAQPTNPTWPQAAPANGNVSVVQQASGYSSGAFTYITTSATAYDSYGRSTATYDANGNESTTSYTTSNGLTTGETDTNPLGHATITTYDPLREIPLTTTDANGVATTLEYDGLGRLTDVWGYNRPTTDAANEIDSYALSNSGPSVVTTKSLNDEGGYVTSTTLYDALLRERQTQVPTPQGGVLVSDDFYDTRGWLYKTNTNWWDSSASPGSTILTVPDSQVPDQSETDFDGLGQPVLVTDYNDSAVVSQTASAYYGDRATTVPPAGGTPTSTVTDALGRTTELDQYTSAPTVTVTTSGKPVITSVSITGGTTQATNYSYNTGSELGTITDASTAEQWTKSYNLLGQITGTTDPNGGATSMTYDNNGNLQTSTGADGHTISYSYDALNRKTGEYDGPSSSSPPIATWDYDNSNNAVSGMTDPIGQLTTETSYSGGQPYVLQQKGFNVFGESLGETETLPSTEGTLQGSYTLSHTYTPATGLPLATSYPASPDGGALPAETVTTGYATGFDLPNTLTTTLEDAYAQDVTYTAWSQVGQEKVGTLSNNAYLTNTYDPNSGNLTDTQVANTAVSTTPYDDTSYTYDPSGNITAETDTRTLPGDTSQSETQCYDYNTLDQLTQAWTATDDCAANPASNNGATVGDGVPGGAYWSSWNFNPLGQRTSETDYSLSGGKNTVTSYSYNGNSSSQPNTLTSTSTSGPSGTSTASYSYDAAGNTVTRDLPSGNQNLTWTDDGKLATDTTSAGKTSYVYDADGNVLLEKDPGQTTLYLFGGAEQIVLNTSTQAVTGTRFIQLPGGGEVVRNGASSDYSFEMENQQGTGVLTLDNTGQNPEWQQYTPYGAPRGDAPASWPDSNGFLGKPTDAGTGLTLVGARAYDPTIGQFLSLDPVLNSDDPGTLNGYTYTASNPLTFTDPTGLMECFEEGDHMVCGDPQAVEHEHSDDDTTRVDSDPDTGWNTPESAPEVSNDTLRSILSQIYARPTVEKAWGNGTIQDALMFEKDNDLSTIEEAFGGKFHVIKAAEALNRLTQLLKEDELSGGELLNDSDRQIALSQTRSLVKALDAPDKSGATTDWLDSSQGREYQYKQNMDKATDSLQDISEFRSGSGADDSGSSSDTGSDAAPDAGPEAAGAADAGGAAADALGILGFLPIMIQIQREGLVPVACSMPGISGQPMCNPQPAA
jgi:RHS repeat-associated protein